MKALEDIYLSNLSANGKAEFLEAGAKEGEFSEKS